MKLHWHIGKRGRYCSKPASLAYLSKSAANAQPFVRKNILHKRGGKAPLGSAIKAIFPFSEGR